MTTSLLFRQIVLLSPAKNYTVEFRPGVNIVMGPIFTGKSSVMELIDYVCGSKYPLAYPEIKKCSDVLVHMTIAGEELTIRRSLANSTAKIVIHFGTLSDVLAGASIESKEVSWKHEKNKDSVSSEILYRLGLGNIEVKSAPTQDASNTNAFSMRDLLRLLYIKQSRMGANPGFFEDDFARFIKWKAAFEIVHGLYDAKATNISKLLKQARDEKKELENELAIIQKFLTESQVASNEDLITQIQEIVRQKEQLEATAEKQRSEEVEHLGIHSDLLEQRETIENDAERMNSQVAELKRTLLQLGRLRVQYERELSQLEFLRESNSLLSPLPVLRCPACLQEVTHSLDETTCYACERQLPEKEEELLTDNQLRSLKFRISDLEKYTTELSSQLQELQTKLKESYKSLRTLDQSIESVRKRTVFPKDRMLLESAAQLSLLEKQEENCRRNLALRARARGEGSNLLALQERINNLQEQLNQVRNNRPTSQNVLAELSRSLSDILNFLKFPWNVDDARLDEQHYIPIVRDQDYKEIRSNGAITLIQCAWEFSLMEYALNKLSLFPRFLMLDSPLNHLGRNSSDPEFRDQQIVDSFYTYIDDLHQKYANEMQIIICDNSPPPGAEHLVVLEYTGKKEQGRFGLIDDEYPPERKPRTLQVIGKNSK